MVTLLTEHISQRRVARWTTGDEARREGNGDDGAEAGDDANDGLLGSGRRVIFVGWAVLEEEVVDGVVPVLLSSAAVLGEEESGAAACSVGALWVVVIDGSTSAGMTSGEEVAGSGGGASESTFVSSRAALIVGEFAPANSFLLTISRFVYRAEPRVRCSPLFAFNACKWFMMFD